MAEPSFVSDTSDRASPPPMIAAELEDGHSPGVQRTARLMAVVILPSIFVILVALAGVLFLLQHFKAGHAAAPQPAAATAMAAPADKDAQILALQSQIATLQNQLLIRQVAPNTGVSPSAAPVLAADSAALTQLAARVDRVEANQRALAHAAAAAAAAEALQNAADSGAPFPTELALAQSQLNNPHLLDAVRPFAGRGIPSKVTLAAQFPRVAAVANSAAKVNNGDKSLLGKIGHALSTFISVRRTDAAPTGVGVEATLAHAEARINGGDLGGAVNYLNTLPAPAQTAIKPWLDEARARVALDIATRQISEAALGTLGQTGGDATGGAL